MPPIKSRSIARLMVFAAAGAACLLAAGCDPAHEIIASTESRSPNGYWVASDSTVRYSGPGNAAVISSVYLQRADKSKPPVEILEFFHDGPGSQTGIGLTMSWADPSHLAVAYNGHASIDFQAVKAAGVNIALQDLSGPASSTSALR